MYQVILMKIKKLVNNIHEFKQITETFKSDLSRYKYNQIFKDRSI